MRRLALFLGSLVLGCGTAAAPMPTSPIAPVASAPAGDAARGAVTAGLFTADNDAWFADDPTWDARALAAECYANALRADATLVGYALIELPTSAGGSSRVVSASPAVARVDTFVACLRGRLERLGPTEPGRRVYLRFR